jgi:putative intracellular protease/amidase
MLFDRPRTICMLVYDGAQSLDITGPLEVFALAGLEVAAEVGSVTSPYERSPCCRPRRILFGSLLACAS